MRGAMERFLTVNGFSGSTPAPSDNQALNAGTESGTSPEFGIEPTPYGVEARFRNSPRPEQRSGPLPLFRASRPAMQPPRRLQRILRNPPARPAPSDRPDGCRRRPRGASKIPHRGGCAVRSSDAPEFLARHLRCNPRNNPLASRTLAPLRPLTRLGISLRALRL